MKEKRNPDPTRFNRRRFVGMEAHVPARVPKITAG